MYEYWYSNVAYAWLVADSETGELVEQFSSYQFIDMLMAYPYAKFNQEQSDI